MRRAILLLLLLPACGGEAAPLVPFDPAVAEPLLADVVDALHAGDGPRALAELDLLASRGPLPDGSLHYRALALEAADRNEEAEKVWRRELLAHPGNARAHAALGRRLMATGRLEEAATHLDLAAKLAPGDAVVRLLSGRLALLRNEDELALRAFNDVLQVDPWGEAAVEAHTGLAQILARRGGDEAQLAERHAATARKLQQLGAYMQSFQLRLQRDPRDAEAAYGVATAYLSLYTDYGDPRLRDQAEKALDYVLSLRPEDARALYNLGFVRAEQGRLDEALEISRRAVQADPALTAARLNLALLCLRQGRSDEAREQLEQVAAEADAPADRVRAHASLARMLAEDTDPAQRAAALGHAETALQLDPQDPCGLLPLAEKLRHEAAVGEPDTEAPPAPDTDSPSDP